MAIPKPSYLLAFACLCLLHQQSSCELLRFDLMRMKSSFHKILEMGLDHRSMKKILAEVKNDSVPLFRYLDSEFYGKILLGHPGQSFKVIFDTAWADAWVPSNRCSITDVACMNHNKYNKKKSSTHKDDGRDIKIPYGNDYLEGNLVIDLLHLGSHNVTSQTFAEMTHVPIAFTTLESDGVFGMGFQSMSLLNVTPFVDNMVQEKVLDKKVFSFYFNRDKRTVKGGTLFLGGSESKHYTGNFTYVKLTGQDFWRFEMDSIHVKGSTENMCGSKACQVIVSTSEAQIKGPTAVIDKINAVIGASKFFFGKYKVSCDQIGNLPAITLTMGGRNFQLKSRDYIQKVTFLGMTFCLTVFEGYDFPKPFEGYWTLGNSFMARYYVEFDADNMRIGFADVRM